MVAMDIFNNDAFSLFSMTAAVQKMPTVPTFLGRLGIFGEGEGVDTNIVGIEQQGMTLKLIPSTPRGTQIPMAETDKRSLRNFNIPRIAKGDQLFAAEIQGIRAFGTESELETVVQKVAQKQAKLLAETALTMEYHRLGAIQGILLDADGSVLYNFFNEFGIAAPTEIDFDLDAASPAEGALLLKIAAAKRAAIRALGAAYVPGVTRFLWLCGDTFYDQFVNHNDVRVTYKNWEAAASLRDASVFNSFRFGEMEWHNYQGTDDNSTVAIPATKAKLIVLGVPGLYRRYNGPGETMETVNTIGQSIYSMLVRDLQRNMWVQPEVYMYPFHICTRPEVLLSGRNT
jgi:hypothetical protein